MLNLRSSQLSAVIVASALVACAAPPPANDNEIRRGTIEQITATQITSSRQTGVGAVLGGLAGVGLGSLIGGGTGRDVAMIAGAVGGAMAGSEVEKKYAQPVPAQQVFVRTSSGVLVEVTQPIGPTLAVGQKVYIQGNGEGARVSPQ